MFRVPLNSFKSKFECILIFCGLLIFSNSIFSQSYQTRIYIEDDGLPSSTINDLTQDAFGRMWFAARSGMAVYDGSVWKKYSPADGLAASNYYKVKADSQGTVWALTRSSDSCLSYFDGKKWSSLPKLDGSNNAERFITSFEVTSVNGETVLAVGTSKLGLYIWVNSQWKRVTPKEGLLSPSVNSIAARNGEFYAATDKGLSVIKEDKVDNSLNEKLILPSPKINGIAIEEADGSPTSPNKNFIIWLRGEDWLGSLEKGVFKVLSRGLQIAPSHNYCLILQPDYRGGLYFGNPDTIFYFNKKTGLIKYLGIKNGLAGEGATSMFLDREGNLWISGFRGVSKIFSMRFANYKEEQGLLEDEVSAVSEAETGTMVFGHNRGLTFFDGGEFRRVAFTKDKFQDVFQTRVMDMQKDSRGNIWAAVADVGVARINPKGVIDWFRKDKRFQGDISSVLVDKSGRVWVAGSGGLFILKSGEFVPVKIEQFPRFDLRRMFQGVDGSIFFATSNAGLYVSHRGEWKHYVSSRGGPADSVYSVLNDSQGRTWVGTMAGLFILDQDALKKVDIKGFQIDRPVYFIIEDNKKRIWFGTDHGVVRWDGQSWRQFAIREGLAGLETNRAAGFVDSQGRVWIGTNRGLSCYQEEYDQVDTVPPLVGLSYLEVSGAEMSLKAVNKLSYNKNNLIFHFRCISFIDESAISYSSRLEGFDKGWLPEYKSLGQQIRYTNLAPGRYRFHLKAKNAAGVWSDRISSSEIIIQKPFWKEWWFYLLSFLFIGFVFYGVQRYFSEKRLSFLLKKQVNERTAQLQESEKKYRTLVETALEGIAIGDSDENLVFVNESFAKMLGYKKEEIVGLNLSQISDKEIFSRFKEETLKRKSGLSSRYDAVLYTKSRKPRHFIISACPLFDENRNFIGTLGLFSDITKRKRAEERVKASLREKEILLQEIHHRVKNNLQIISSLINLQSGFIKNKEIAEMFKSSQDRIRTMSLIHERLYQSKDFARIDFKDYISHLTSALFRSYEVHSSSIKLKINVKDVYLDINKLIPCGLIINEIVTNSLKHAFPEGRQGRYSLTFIKRRTINLF